MEQRKQMGLKVLMFLVVMSLFFYVAKKRIWRKIGH
jgi:ubiquinol-cytochrome c reductase cytochrome c1 subunit